MTITNLLAAYQNGNVSVTLFSDGTKVREFEGSPKPLHPESIDLKITDWCDAGCPWCHENSLTTGKHALVSNVTSILSGLHPGNEVAIGGGDPLSHPQLREILEIAKSLKLIPNLTVNGRHVRRNNCLISELRQDQLIYGLGVSYFKPTAKDISSIVDSNTVIHVIAGVDSISDVERFPKILILGYKHYGRGLRFYTPTVDTSIAKWRYWLPRLSVNSLVSFDNLALNQLRVRELLDADYWNEHYMGDDGTFTFYIDAVTMSFARTSATQRQAINGQTVSQMFSAVQS